MPTVERVDTLSFFDIDFEGESFSDEQLAHLRQWSDATSHCMNQFRDGLRWMFQWTKGTETCLDGMERIDLTKLYENSGLRVSLLVSREYGVGVLCVWQKDDGCADPLTKKTDAWDIHYKAMRFFAKALHDAGSLVVPTSIERRYPLTGVRIAERVGDILKSREEQIVLGKWFTGNYEMQTEDSLIREIMDQNLSNRSYELLFIRWTDALAVYDSSVGSDYETALFRVALIYETTIILRRLLSSLGDRMDVTAASLRAYWPDPWAVNERLEALAKIRTTLITRPPVQSIEAMRLLSAAYNAFGIPSFVDHTSEKARFLESRWQWTKTQFLVILGLITYLMDKFELFKSIRQLF